MPHLIKTKPSNDNFIILQRLVKELELSYNLSGKLNLSQTKNLCAQLSELARIVASDIRSKNIPRSKLTYYTETNTRADL